MSPRELILAWADARRAVEQMEADLRTRYAMISPGAHGLVPEPEWSTWLAALETERAARAAVLAYAEAERRDR